MTLLTLCEQIGAKCPRHLEEQEVRGITSSSKKVKDGYVFVCIEGTHIDGHLYIGEALERGALAVVVEKKEYLNGQAIFSPNSRKTLSYMLDAFYSFPSKKMKFIGVTGTNGKTSVSVMLKNILDSADIPCGLIGTVKCSSLGVEIEKHPDNPLSNMTTPDPEELYPMLASMACDGVRYVIMEATSHALFLEKLAPIEFDVGIFTNLTQDHLDFHPSMDEYFKAKLKLFEQSRVGIVNIDDAFGEKIKELAPCTVKTCSARGKNCDYGAENIKNMSVSGVEYTLESADGSFPLYCSVPGTFSVMNSMQAAACAMEIGIDSKTVQRSFESFCGICGRLERVSFSEDVDFSVFIDYAHTPDALENLISSAKGFRAAGQRIVLLFGCGGDRDRGKRSKMGRIATDGADFVIITSDNSRSEDPESIIKEILTGVDKKDNFTVIPDRKAAIEYAIASSRAGDIILLAGKGHETYEINASGRHAFDERSIAADAVKKYYCKKREN